MFFNVVYMCYAKEFYFILLGKRLDNLDNEHSMYALSITLAA